MKGLLSQMEVDVMGLAGRKYVIVMGMVEVSAKNNWYVLR